MKKILLILFAFQFLSCLTPKKLDKFFEIKPELAARKCVEVFPIKETIDTITISDTAIIEAYKNEMTHLSSILDSLKKKGCDTQYIETIKEIVKNQPVKVETKYIIKTQENTAKLKVLQDSMNVLIKQKDKEIDEIGEQYKAKHDEYLACSAKYVDMKGKADELKKERNKAYWWIVLLLIILFRKPIVRLLGKLVTKS